jgi:long-chain acyl-CoA synthetase
LENLRTVEGPVIFASNHQSHMDTPVILAALPGKWRRQMATAMAKEFFKAHFFPEEYTRGEVFRRRLEYYLSSAFFNAFPLPQREAGARQTLRYAGELVSSGFSILIYPEGRRTEHGEINPFRPGVGMMAARLQVPVIPIRLQGLEHVLPVGARMATPGRVSVSIGAPLQLSGEDYTELTLQVERAVRNLGA